MGQRGVGQVGESRARGGQLVEAARRDPRSGARPAARPARRGPAQRPPARHGRPGARPATCRQPRCVARPLSDRPLGEAAWRRSARRLGDRPLGSGMRATGGHGRGRAGRRGAQGGPVPGPRAIQRGGGPLGEAASSATASAAPGAWPARRGDLAVSSAATRRPPARRGHPAGPRRRLAAAARCVARGPSSAGSAPWAARAARCPARGVPVASVRRPPARRRRQLGDCPLGEAAQLARGAGCPVRAVARMASPKTRSQSAQLTG